jgi:hypothetical protein
MSAWRVDALILSCAISAGVHGALIGEHGVSFAVATVAAAAAAVLLTLRPADVVVRGAAVVLLLGFLAAYAAAITTGLPLVHPEVEPVEGLAVFTKVVEALGATTATPSVARFPLVPHPKGI